MRFILLIHFHDRLSPDVEWGLPVDTKKRTLLRVRLFVGGYDRGPWF